MFSHRTDWNLTENSLTSLLRQKRSRGDPVLSLTESNPTLCGLFPPEDLRTLFSNPGALSYDPHPRGLPSARAAIAEYYLRQGCTVDPESIILTSGTSEAYSYLFNLLCNHGDSVLTPRPGYPLFGILADLHDLRLRPYELVYAGDWQINLNALRDAIEPQTRAIILLHPHNPAGSFIRDAERKELISLCAHRSIPLIVDEVFHPFALDVRFHRPSFAGNSDGLVLVLNGLSKMAGLPQWKLGWIVVSGPQPLRNEALHRLEMIADTFLSVGLAPQLALPEVLKNIGSLTQPIVERIRENHAWLQASIGHDLSLLHAESGWNAILRFPGTKSDEQWCLDILEHCNVLLHPGHYFDCSVGTNVVLSLLPFPDVFQEALKRVFAYLGQNAH